MRLDRGAVFFCIMILSLVVLTSALAAAVYNGTPAENRTPYNENSNLDYTLPEVSPTGNLLGGTGGHDYVVDNDDRGDQPGEMGEVVPAGN